MGATREENTRAIMPGVRCGMSQMTPEVSKLLEKALALSVEEQEATR
jgi:hypothetical protein